MDWGGVRVAVWSGGRGSGLGRGDASFCKPSTEVEAAVCSAAAAMRAAGSAVAEARPATLTNPNDSLALYRRLLRLDAESVEGAEGAAVRAGQEALGASWAAFFGSAAELLLLPNTVSNAFASDPAPGQDACAPGARTLGQQRSAA